MPLEIAIIAYPQEGSVEIQETTINGVRFAELYPAEPYAIKMFNDGDHPIKVKLWVDDHPQQRRASSFLGLLAEVIIRRDGMLWSLNPGEEALHPACSAFVFKGTPLTIVAQVYDEREEEIDREGMILVPEGLVKNLT